MVEIQGQQITRVCNWWLHTWQSARCTDRRLLRRQTANLCSEGEKRFRTASASGSLAKVETTRDRRLPVRQPSGEKTHAMGAHARGDEERRLAQA